MMQKINNFVKSRTAKYALAGALTIGGVFGNYNFANAETKSLPVYEEVIQKNKIDVSTEKQREDMFQKSYLDGQTKKYFSFLEESKNKFNKGIEDRVLNLPEQEDILKELENATKVAEEIKGFCAEKRIENPLGKYSSWTGCRIPKEYRNLQVHLYENLHGQDEGIPELQKELKKNGLEVKVEPKGTGMDILCGLADAGLGIIGSILLIGWLTEKNRE